MRRAVHKPNSEPPGPAVDRARLSAAYREYHRLLVRAYLLRVRVGGLRVLAMLLSPFFTPGLLTMLHRWFDDLHSDLVDFRKRCSAFRMELRAVPRPFQNPWV